MGNKTVKLNITTWPELGINYWGINKVATSTFKNYFYFLATGLKFEDIEDTGDTAKLRLMEEHRYITREEAFNNKLFNFGLCRNPYDRFVSCYNQFFLCEDEHLFERLKLDNITKEATPDDFLKAIEQDFKKEPFYKNKIYISNKHFQRQSFYLRPGKINVIKLENLEKEWNLNFPPPKFTSNKGKIKKPKLEYNKEFFNKLYEKDFEIFGYEKEYI